MALKLLSYNIRYGGAGREAQLAGVIRACDPDIVVFQEATLPRVVERLASDTGMTSWAARTGHSLAYMSRTPPARHEWHDERLRPRRGFLEIELGGSALRVFGVHLSAIHSRWTERRRMRELRVLLESIAARRGEPHILVGDFNTLAPGELLDIRRLPPRLRPLVWLSGGRVKFETVQLMLDAGYVDGYRRLNPEREGHTFPTWDPHLRLDFAFVPTPFAPRLEECRVIDDAPSARLASDHFPLLARVALS